MMALHPVLDIDFLRSLVFVAEEASFTRAAERIGRTQSAVTLQIQKLEALVGRPLLVRSKGGPVELTPHGHVLVEHAKVMLKLNDDALRAVSSSVVSAPFRLGVSEYYTPFYLQRTLEGMRAAYPDVMVEIFQGRSCQIVAKLKDGAFDLIVSEGGVEPRDVPLTEVWRGPLRWITATSEKVHLRDPVPLALLPSNCPWRPPWMDDCFWRSAALRALHQAGRAYRVIAVSDTMAVNFASVREGRAITISVDAMLPEGVRAVSEEEGLPPLPDTRVVMLKAQNAPQPLTDAVGKMIMANFSIV
jgi:DNA-binding transcriptional LysR family regulator